MENILQHLFRYGRQIVFRAIRVRSETIIAHPRSAYSMRFHDSLKRLHQHKTFIDWRAQNKDHTLAHGFFMIDPKIKEEWQIGYYSPHDDRIVTFSIDDENEVVMNPPSEVFKKDAKVKALDPSAVTQDAEHAVQLARELQQTKYKGHDPSQIMVLLQHLERGQVWNISMITKTFSIVNVKIDASTNTVVADSCETLLAWGDAQPGELRKG